jgi:hypothetical protein
MRRAFVIRFYVVGPDAATRAALASYGSRRGMAIRRNVTVMKMSFRPACNAAAAGLALFAALLCQRVALAAPAACGASPFPVGSELPEPGPTQHVARIFALRSADGTVRAGSLYLTPSGATYYLSETSDVTPKAVALEMGFLEAAGYAPAAARQYTHLAEIPAVPPIPHGLALAKRRGLRTIACN